MERISPEQVRAQVHKFWKILSGKSNDNLDQLYAADAIVFAGKSKRTEPAALTAARRMRHLSGPTSDLNVEVADIDVQIVENVAIATYIYQFHEVKKGSDGGRLEKKTRFGRATQIFQHDESGRLQIVHEHLSTGEAPEIGARA
jgi:ketosteroid isomerase-like protein